MVNIVRAMRRTGALLTPLALLLVGCGQKVVVPSGAEKALTQLIERRTGVTPQHVHCPSGVNAKAGQTFDCHFEAPDGTKYVAHMRITRVNGSEVHFYITAGRA
jgi:hypothetical protein